MKGEVPEVGKEEAIKPPFFPYKVLVRKKRPPHLIGRGEQTRLNWEPVTTRNTERSTIIFKAGRAAVGQLRVLSKAVADILESAPMVVAFPSLGRGGVSSLDPDYYCPFFCTVVHANFCSFLCISALLYISFNA